jgi:hypothetical protein
MMGALLLPAVEMLWLPLQHLKIGLSQMALPERR